ncbi:kinase-like domain-containing protein [Apodospora peruviana]|uniref:non-specific serine/threonine protein kinase n=1 Tax=Apodospora peruviana TaxID=516989 RepID=A0AAE0HYV5_9PEZI|nr:kinase-like domain-containing protein [Apodospora peruviana]
MTFQPSTKTLFHLQPLSSDARDALQHPDNRRFVSSNYGRPGLEIGFHVPSVPGGRTIARLGRDADLILCGKSLSRVHVAFEIHPETLVVLLSVRSSQLNPGVTVQPPPEDTRTDDKTDLDGTPDSAVEQIQGDCVIQYGQEYEISIGPTNVFRVRWHQIDGLSGTAAAAVLRERAVQGYRESQKQADALISRLQPTEITSSDLRSWYATRLHTAKSFSIREVPAARKSIGRGAFGEVFRGVDNLSGGAFAVKQIRLGNTGDVERARSTLHREIKTLEMLSHANIIELLATKGWGTDVVEIFMPLRDGTLDVLAGKRIVPDDDLCMEVLRQVLQALDYLAFRNQCHRDIKPQNILFSDLGQGKYLFQVADFGLANHASLANTFCGTGLYMAPEFFPEHGGFSQSPKVDVWSLFVTILAIHSNLDFPPPGRREYGDILQAVRQLKRASVVKAMARENPHRRASAAQMLVALFEGKGLTTPRSQVAAIVPDDTDDGVAPPQQAVQQARASPPGREISARGGRQKDARPAGPTPLVVYPIHNRRRAQAGSPVAAQQVPHPHRGGVAKPAAQPAGRRRQVLGRELDRALDRARGKGPEPRKRRDGDLSRNQRVLAPAEGPSRMPGRFPGG